MLCVSNWSNCVLCLQSFQLQLCAYKVQGAVHTDNEMPRPLLAKLGSWELAEIGLDQAGPRLPLLSDLEPVPDADFSWIVSDGSSGEDNIQFLVNCMTSEVHKLSADKVLWTNSEPILHIACAMPPIAFCPMLNACCLLQIAFRVEWPMPNQPKKGQ